MESGGHDADDRVWRFVHDHSAADHAPVTGVSPLPQPMAERDDRHAILVGARKSPNERLRTKDRVERRRSTDRTGDVDAFGTRELEAVEYVAADGGERFAVFLPVEEIGKRRGVP